MASVVVEKSADELLREIQELNRQQREITERIRDPRGLRKGAGVGVRGRGAGATRLPGRGFSRRGDAIDGEDQPATKKRLLSAVVKVDGDEVDPEVVKDDIEEPKEAEVEKVEELKEEQQHPLQRSYPGGRKEFRRGGEWGPNDQENLPSEPLPPRVLPKVDDPNLAKRNRRMFGALLGTLEKFRQEDQKLSGSEAFLRRSTSQKKAEQRAQEESERLRQQEREQLAGKRKRDLILRARLAAKAEEKHLELLFIQWTEHHSKLCSFLRTKAEPSVFYAPAKPSEETDKLLEARQQDLAEWKRIRRVELTEHQKQVTEEHLSKVEVDIERWQAAPNYGNNITSMSHGEEMEDGIREGEQTMFEVGRRKSRIIKVSEENPEEYPEEALVEQADAVKEKDEGKEKTARKETAGSAALTEVMGYGSGDDEMDER